MDVVTRIIIPDKSIYNKAGINTFVKCMHPAIISLVESK